MKRSLFVPTRVDQPELLDEHDAPRADMERSLRDLRRFNKYYGGTRVYRHLLRKLGDVRSVVDVGAGSADLVSGVPGLGRRVALDFNIAHLHYGRDRAAFRVVGDAARLPFRSGSVDAVTSAHFFHHFSAGENEKILREALRVARIGVAVNDTRRHYVPFLFVRLLAVLRLVGRITRFDAPASILRGYTTSEAREVASRAGAARAAVVNMWPFRFGILLWR